jgi:hypothetical protein
VTPRRFRAENPLIDLSSFPGPALFDRFCTVMTNLRNDTVHVHCIVNARVSAFFYRYQRDVLGSDEAKARAAMETVWRPGGDRATL